MTSMTQDSQFAPWWDDQERKTPMCPHCKGYEVRYLLGCYYCYDCRKADQEHKFTEY